MNTLLNQFLLLPLWFRSAVLVFLVLFLLWAVFGKIIFWILSVVPFFGKKIFQCLYLLVEIPISFLHKKFGSKFYRIDNQLSQVFEKIEQVIHCWYKAWHFPKKKSFIKFLIIYGLCMLYILIPFIIKSNIDILNIGQKTYIYGETFLIDCLEKQGWKDLNMQYTANQDENLEAMQTHSFELSLIVLTESSSSLLVRDIPSVEDYVVLDELYNDDRVIWRGEMVFSQAGEYIEPWAKIETANGVEGWSRLVYLYPEQYEELEFLVTN